VPTWLPRRIGDNRNLVIICGLIAASQMSWGVVVPVLPLYARGFGASGADLGLIVSLFGVGRLIINIPAGRLAERYDQRHLLLGAVSAVVACSVVTGFAGSLTQLFVLRFATGLAGGAAITVGQAFIAHSTTVANRGRAMGTLQAFQLAGGAIGPSFGGVMASLFGLRASFVSSGLVALAFVVWGALRLQPVGGSVPDVSDEGGAETAKRGWLLHDPSFVAICVVGFAVFFARFGGQQFLVPILAYDEVGLTAGQLGLALGAVTTANIVLVSFAGRAADRIGRKRVIVPAMVLAGLATLGYIWADDVVTLLVVLCFVGLCNTFSGPTPAAYLADVAPPGRQGAAVGVFRTFGDLAGLIGPVLLGWLVEHSGTDAAIVVLAAVSVTAGTWFAFRARETVVLPTAGARPSQTSPGSEGVVAGA